MKNYEDYDEDEYVHISYDYIDNGAGELMIVMDQPKGAADDENAKVIFDGFHEAMLLRNHNQVVHLPIVPEAVREMLNSLEKILVTEMDDRDIADVYEAEVVIINRSLPIQGSVYVRLDKTSKPKEKK